MTFLFLNCSKIFRMGKT